MSKFHIHGESWDTGEKQVFIYDSETSTITHNNEELTFPEFQDYKGNFFRKAKQFNIDKPASKSNQPYKLKIQLGLKCNYSCEYCSQTLHANESVDFTPKQIKEFINKLDNLDLSKVNMVEFWGGEPFVYWKTMKSLVKELDKKYPGIRYLTITNGSVLSEEIIEFLDQHQFSIGMSHDGPGQHLRGPDPFEDPVKMALIQKLYDRLAPKGRMSFNTVLTKSNTSRKDIAAFFQQRFGNDVALGEGAFIDAYNDGGLELSLYDYQDMLQYRRQALSELSELSRKNVSIFNSKVELFIKSIINKRHWTTIGQKCGMDSERNLAIDMNGDVLTCQNVSSKLTSWNGESHRIGNIEAMEDVKLNTGTHWSLKFGCSHCPVLHICGGSCFMLEGEHWNRSCDNAYNDNIVFFMYAFEVLTGYVPYWIEGAGMPEWRKDVLGMQWPDIKREPQKKIIPIKAV